MNEAGEHAAALPVGSDAWLAAAAEALSGVAVSADVRLELRCVLEAGSDTAGGIDEGRGAAYSLLFEGGSVRAVREASGRELPVVTFTMSAATADRVRNGGLGVLDAAQAGDIGISGSTAALASAAEAVAMASEALTGVGS